MAQQSGAPMKIPGAGRGQSQGDFRKPKNLFGTLLRILKYLNKGYVAIIFVTLIISSASSLISSALLRPLLNNYIIPGDIPGLAKFLIFMGIVGLLGVAASYIQSRTSVSMSQSAINTIRRELFDKMQGLPLRYYDTHTHGELMSRYTNDAENVQTMLEQSVSQLLSSVIVLVGSIVLMLYYSPILFIVSACVLLVISQVIRVMGGKSRKYFQSQQKILGDLNGNIEETIGGLREIKAFNHEEEATNAFQKLNREFQLTAGRANFFAGAIMPVLVNLNNVAYALVSVFGGILIALGRFDVGSLASYLQFSRMVGMPINQISNQLNNVYSAVAGAERIFAMMDELPEADEGTVTLEPYHSGDGERAWSWVLENGEKVPLKGDVRFFHVDFAYDPEKPILKDISLYAKPGQMIAFVGSTGAGKTTITNLINRFYDVQSGSITYDGIDVRQIRKESLRRSLGMVLQDTHLFTGSVLENIRYGRLDATDGECVEAAKKANAHSFISRLPKGYDTVIKGDGDNLSQGQRQLIAIARAYISQPPVMILDEATSSIDTRTERQLQKGMNELMRGRTVFVIAHRLSTIRMAKAIIVLEHGEIIERGSHEELLALKGRYFQLHHGMAELD